MPQQGGRKPVRTGAQVGPLRTLRNGAKAAFFQNLDGGKPVFRIVSSTAEAARAASAARSNPRKISQAQAAEAFRKYYARNTHTIRRGPRKGQKKFASKAGLKRAMSYDKNHTNPKMVVDDARYLRNPHAYEFKGVDTGAKKRKPLSAAQKAALAKGRAALAKKRNGQVGGYWW